MTNKPPADHQLEEDEFVAVLFTSPRKIPVMGDKIIITWSTIFFKCGKQLSLNLHPYSKIYWITMRF